MSEREEIRIHGNTFAPSARRSAHLLTYAVVHLAMSFGVTFLVCEAGADPLQIFFGALVMVCLRRGWDSLA